MTFSVLLSAMFLQDENYIDTLNITSDAVVINQCDCVDEKRIVRTSRSGSEQKVDFISTTERGLSRSRNMAIDMCDSDICILCDNDVEYEPHYEETICRAFEEHPEADLIVFFIKRPERSRPIFGKIRRMGYLSVLKIFSPEIAFRKKSIEGIRFDIEFGAGSKYYMGEENLFLYECLKQHKKIVYVPTKIATLRDEQSTWFKGYGRDYFVTRGANYAAMSRLFGPILNLQFALRKTRLYKPETSFWNALSWMREGAKEIKGRKNC